MGASLVAQAVNWAPHLSDRAFRVLVCMALTAKDNDSRAVKAGLYFGGQQPLVRVLSQKRNGTTESGVKTVKRAVEELTRLGAIRCTQPAIKNSNAIYEMTLLGEPILSENDESASMYFEKRRDTPSPPGRDTPSPPAWTPGVPPGGTLQVPPCKEPLEEPLQELKEEEGVDLRTAAAVVAPNAESKIPDTSPAKCSDPTCAMGYVIDPTKPRGRRNIRCPTCNPAPAKILPFQRHPKARPR